MTHENKKVMSMGLWGLKEFTRFFANIKRGGNTLLFDGHISCAPQEYEVLEIPIRGPYFAMNNSGSRVRHGVSV